MSICQTYLDKIKEYQNENTYVVLYREGCPYSQRALALLKKKNKPYKGYIIDRTEQKNIADCLSEKKEINKDSKHTTVPMIFYRGKFIGGFSELSKQLP